MKSYLKRVLFIKLSRQPYLHLLQWTMLSYDDNGDEDYESDDDGISNNNTHNYSVVGVLISSSLWSS